MELRHGWMTYCQLIGGPPHAVYTEIVRLGMGQFTHYEDWVIFSSSDNSDPNSNGRTYKVVMPAR
jgi:hypothetical protein